MLRCIRRVQPTGKIPRHSIDRRHFSITSARHDYAATLERLNIGGHTRVIFQGFTGKYSGTRIRITGSNDQDQATANAKESIEWGTNIVGGVTPGREGEHLGLPVLPTVRKAMEVLRPDATGIYVAAHQATGAIEEAIEAQVPLIVAVAEHIPLHDLIRIHSMLKTQSVSRLVGPNSPGIISAVGKCRIGFQPLPCFQPGSIGIVARSGTLSYETAASTSRSGLGQSMCIGVGGDVLPGTGLTDGLQVLAKDPSTKGIALVGEIGGEVELEAAAWIKEYRASTKTPKPIVALVGGVNAVPGRVMGHAGAFALPGEPVAAFKAKALNDAGAAIVNHPSRFGPALKAMLTGSTPSGMGVTAPNYPMGRREIHTRARRPVTVPLSSTVLTRPQSRSLYVTKQIAYDMLKQQGIPVADALDDTENPLLVVTVNRSTNSPCVTLIPVGEKTKPLRHDFDYGGNSCGMPISNMAESLGLNPGLTSSLGKVIDGLIDLFFKNEAFLLETRVAERDGSLVVTDAKFGFDDAAFRSCGRQAQVHALRDLSLEVPEEVEAEKDGIVYIKLEDGNIGTLVNGAGLAMNTVDALIDAGGKAANFLDTGGKATSETVKKCFEVILADSRVKCILVNIMGGLTRGDMIAQGVILAFRDLKMDVPVVVRIRGTNEKEGQKIISESGLPLFAFDDFDEAAAKAIELAERAT